MAGAVGVAVVPSLRSVRREGSRLLEALLGADGGLFHRLPIASRAANVESWVRVCAGVRIETSLGAGTARDV